MSILTLLNAILSLLSGTLTGLGANDKYRKVITEVQAALSSIETARNEILTNTELESLRTTPQW